jgi:hypothetical protein
MSFLSSLCPFPCVAPIAPISLTITYYDQSHFNTYARLLGDERAGIDWVESARVILRCNVTQDLEVAHTCWHSHLLRAHWLVKDGLHHAVYQSAPCTVH